jgi:hypothetical protein
MAQIKNAEAVILPCFVGNKSKMTLRYGKESGFQSYEKQACASVRSLRMRKNHSGKRIGEALSR